MTKRKLFINLESDADNKSVTNEVSEKETSIPNAVPTENNDEDPVEVETEKTDTDSQTTEENPDNDPSEDIPEDPVEDNTDNTINDNEDDDKEEDNNPAIDDSLDNNDDIEVLNSSINSGLSNIEKILAKIVNSETDKEKFENDINTLSNLKTIVSEAVDKNSNESFYINKLLRISLENILYRTEDKSQDEKQEEVDPSSDNMKINNDSLMNAIVKVFKKINDLIFESEGNYEIFYRESLKTIKLISRRNELIDNAVNLASDSEIKRSYLDNDVKAKIIKTLNIGNTNIEELLNKYSNYLENSDDVLNKSLETIEELFNLENVDFSSLYSSILKETGLKKIENTIDNELSVSYTPLIENNVVTIRAYSDNTTFRFSIEENTVSKKLVSDLETLKIEDIQNINTTVKSNILILSNTLDNKEKILELSNTIKDFIKPNSYRNIKNFDYLNNIRNLFLFIDSLNKYLNINLIRDDLLMLNSVQNYIIQSIENFK